jgi:hypothetical protein
MRENVTCGRRFVHGKFLFLGLTHWDSWDCGGTLAATLPMADDFRIFAAHFFTQIWSNSLKSTQI